MSSRIPAVQIFPPYSLIDEVGGLSTFSGTVQIPAEQMAREMVLGSTSSPSEGGYADMLSRIQEDLRRVMANNRALNSPEELREISSRIYQNAGNRDTEALRRDTLEITSSLPRFTAPTFFSPPPIEKVPEIFHEVQVYPFDIERALNGDKVILKNGCEVNQIYMFDMPGHSRADLKFYPVVALVLGEPLWFSKHGISRDNPGKETLFMKYEKSEDEIL